MKITSSRPRLGFGIDFVDKFIGNDVILQMRSGGYGQNGGQNEQLHFDPKVNLQLMMFGGKIASTRKAASLCNKIDAFCEMRCAVFN